MNELVFALHIFLSLLFLLFSFRLGKEAITAFLSLSAVLANLFVVKQTTLFGLTVTCSDVYAVQAIFALNLLQEYYGKAQAQKASVIGFGAMIFFACMAKMHLLYPPALVDTTQRAFMTILEFTPRIITASIGTFFLVQRFDIAFFRLLRRAFRGRYFALRTALSLVVSQSVDTVLFAFLGLYGIADHLVEVILFSLLIKFSVIWCTVPFALVAKRFVPKEAACSK
ncbi:MAG: queuosine precursor transporter [Chlamydiota bacterium]